MSLSAPVKEFLETCDSDNAIIPFRPALVDVTRSIYAACLLSQLLYWSPRSRNPDGWIYKTQKDLYRELRLNRYQLERARGRLLQLGFVETVVKRANGQPVTHYRVNVAAVESALFALSRGVPSEDAAAAQGPGIASSVEGEQTDVQKVGNSICAGCANGSRDSEQMDLSTVDKSVTETTTETTTEITADTADSGNARVRGDSPGKTRKARSGTVTTRGRTSVGRDSEGPARGDTPFAAPAPEPSDDALFAILERVPGFPRTRDHDRLRELMADYPAINCYLEFKKFAEYWSTRKLKRPWLALRHWLDRSVWRDAARPASIWHRGSRSDARDRCRRLPRVYTPPPVYDD